jgi:hypothetical protein
MDAGGRSMTARTRLQEKVDTGPDIGLSHMKTATITVYQHGRPLSLEAVMLGGTTITIQGGLLRTAMIHNEWINRVEEPKEVADALRRKRLADLFTFWELLRDTTPQYDFPMEWVPISALPITTHEEWASRQARKEVRKNIKKASRRGVEVRPVEFDAELVAAITRIFNEVSVRQGKPFWHYGKGIEEVKAEMGQDLDRSHFIGAYFAGELIGFYKLMIGGCFAQPVMSLSMVKHRDKYTDTALISEAVKFCAERRLRYMTYGEWRRDNHRMFLEGHGFNKVLIPRYYVPLTYRGYVSLKLRVHNGLKEGLKRLLPDSVLAGALTLRSRWYQRALQPPEPTQSGQPRS